MEAVLNCRPEDLEDYYGLLGCDELSSTEQILNEYKIRALACHPDKHLDNPKAVAEFQKLQEAKEVLCNDTKRKNYDLWKRSGVAIPFQEWQALKDSVKTSMHWAVRNKKEPMLEAPKAETEINVHDEDLHCQREASGMHSSEASLSSSDFCHRRFRWASDSPSCLLQKFRNYDI
ncbi:dnaJ homolog subfamily C member 12 [Corythoichthys intestinalis]|uniref:dnaJ homolog subfamily C member 12 n=1 Tax=Corythoichthys intestinalis TaxID=161448 RepID=UPI0025A604E5|nr:dnaJ homolog subfamily C member 12 [Corythoichthys intestinalis]XP_061794642.1 dnaJ homolog subfamily C member 12 [Nerophis lumbriciformis]